MRSFLQRNGISLVAAVIAICLAAYAAYQVNNQQPSSEVICVPGAAGEDGEQGPVGDCGPQGETGAIGPMGPQGPTGPQGQTGETGAAGPQGPKGDKGDTGNTGPAGEQGPIGPTGAQGPIGPQGPAGGFGAYGVFYDFATLPITKAVANPILLRNPGFASGVSIVDQYKISFSQAGKYNIAFSSQIMNTANNRRIVTIWLSKNGIDQANWVPESSTDLIVGKDTETERIVAAWNFFAEAQPGDYYVLMVTADNDGVSVFGNTSLNLLPSGLPQIPATILTVNQVG